MNRFLLFAKLLGGLLVLGLTGGIATASDDPAEAGAGTASAADSVMTTESENEATAEHPVIPVPEAAGNEAETEGKSEQAPAEPAQEVTFPDWIETSRLFVSGSVVSMSGAVDDFLSRDEKDVMNESYLRLRLAYVMEEGRHNYPQNDLKLKVDLPKTEDRWSIVFETDPDEFEPLEEQYQNRPGEEGTITETDGSIGAVRFMLDYWHSWRGDIDIGVKAPLPLNSFVRLNLHRKYRIGDYWQSRVSHSVYFFHEEGFGEHSSVTLYHPLSPDWFFFNMLDLQWQDDGDVLEYGEIVSLRHRATDRDFLTYRLGGYYEDHPGSRLKSYFVDMSYRRRLHANWLFFEIIPNVTWSEEEHFNDLASITFRLEVYFRGDLK